MNENNKVTTLDLSDNDIDDDGARSLSIALMNEKNKLITLDFYDNNIGDEGVKSLSTALMNGNNKVTTLKLSWNRIGDDGARFLSTALMNENNKLTTLDLNLNNIGPQGFAVLLRSLRFSLVSHLKIAIHNGLNPKIQFLVTKFSHAFNKYAPRLVCLASVRTIPRIGSSSHLRMVSSDILIRAAQTLGWFLDLKGTIRMLEEHAG